MSRPAWRGFTLIEVLVSLTVVMVLVGAATAAFMQLRTMTRRIQARQALCDTARVAFDRLRGDCDAMVHAGAWWLRSTSGGAVELVFLRGKTDMLDFSSSAEVREPDFGQINPITLTDLLWTRLHWDPATGELGLGSSRPLRLVQLTQGWSSPAGRDFNGAYAVFLPQGVRQSGSDPQTVLDANRIGNGDPADLGDYGDLVAGTVPLATGCTDLAMQAVLGDGSVVEVSSAVTRTLAGDGLPVDGRGSAAAQRPRLLRLRFTLRSPDSRVDPATGLDDPASLIQQTFSFTFRTPSLAPGP